jgi:hypothetical protein
LTLNEVKIGKAKTTIEEFPTPINMQIKAQHNLKESRVSPRDTKPQKVDCKQMENRRREFEA